MDVKILKFTEAKTIISLRPSRRLFVFVSSIRVHFSFLSNALEHRAGESTKMKEGNKIEIEEFLSRCCQLLQTHTWPKSIFLSQILFFESSLFKCRIVIAQEMMCVCPLSDTVVFVIFRLGKIHYQQNLHTGRMM